MSDNRPIVYHDDQVDAWVYRASSAGRSLRTLAAARQGYTPLAAPDYLIAAAEAGNRFERVVKATMRAEGFKITGEQGSMDVEVVPGVIIRGHLDGRHCLRPGDDTDRILEVKSMSQRVFNEWTQWGFDRFTTYAWQLSIYMHGEAQRRGYMPEAQYAVVNRDSEKSYPEIEYRIFKEPLVTWNEISAKLQVIEHLAREGQLPPCDPVDKYVCPYAYLCDKDDHLFEELEDGSEEALRRLADQYDEIRKLESDLKARKDVVRDEIVTALRTRDKVRISDWSFSFAPSTRKRLDTTLLRKVLAEHDEELDRFYEEYQTKPTLRVTRTTKEGEEG